MSRAGQIVERMEKDFQPQGVENRFRFDEDVFGMTTGVGWQFTDEGWKYQETVEERCRLEKRSGRKANV